MKDSIRKTPSFPRRRGPIGVLGKSLGSRLRGNDGEFVMRFCNTR